jgi:hypothetical protein
LEEGGGHAQSFFNSGLERLVDRSLF